MRSRRKKQNILAGNILSIIVLIVFVVLELSYLNIGFKSDFAKTIDNLPDTVISYAKNKLPIKTTNYVDDIVVATTNDAEINVTDKTSDIISIKDKRLKLATVDTNYFDNALFIGDSRMVGFSLYRHYDNATYFCYQSASAFNILENEVEIEPYGSIRLVDLLTLHRFDKIYISLGINSLAAGIDNHKAHYKALIDIVTTLQPQAIVYLMSNMHVTGDINITNTYINNENINLVNKFIEEFADNRQTFYFDVNEIYDDENGNLNKELTSDHAHVYLRHYDRYLYFLLTHALVEDTSTLD